MEHSPLNCVQVSPNASTHPVSFHIISERECICMLGPISTSSGDDKGHHLVPERFLSFPLVKFFWNGSIPFFLAYHFSSMAERGSPWKGGVLCPCPSQYPFTGTFGLLRSSLGKDMTDAVITTSSGIQDGTKQTDGVRSTDRL